MKKTIIILAFFLLIIAAQLYPFFFSENGGKVFMGINYNVVDTNTYFSFMQQAEQGHFFFTNKYSVEKFSYLIFNPVYLVAGWLGIFLTPLVSYYLFKLVFLAIFAYLAYKLLKISVNKDEINTSLLFVLFGSGIGYMFIFLDKFGIKKLEAIDYWISETNSVALNIAPLHFIVSVCLMILIVIYYNKFWETKNPLHFAIFSFSTLLLGFIHLFDVVVLAIAFALYMLWRLISKKESFYDIFKYNLVYGFLAVIPFIYTYIIFGLNPLFSQWNSQNVLQSPKLMHLVFGYLFPLIFSCAYFLSLIFHKRKFKEIEVMLFAWVFAGLILLYSPFNIQRRFLEGLNIPIMVLGSLGFTRIVSPSAEKIVNSIVKIKHSKAILTFLILILISPTSFYWLYKVNANTTPYIKIGDYSVPYYLDKSELEALRWLKSNAEKEDVILSGYAIGNYAPRISGNRVFLGHWAQTTSFEKKKAEVEKFFSENNDIFRKDFIKRYGINYVYYGTEEQNIGKFKPDYMEKVFENNRVTIYKAI